MLEIIIISNPMPIETLKQLALSQFIDMIKGVVDIEKEVIAIGGSLHADEESVLLENGSLQHNLWGINIYFDVDEADRIEFDSMINIGPSQGNKSRGVEDAKTREKIMSIINHLIIF
jgi:hypothetical protein